MNIANNELCFKRVNRDIKVLLAELEEIISANDENIDPATQERNNQAFLELLDQIVDQADTLKGHSKFGKRHYARIE